MKRKLSDQDHQKIAEQYLDGRYNQQELAQLNCIKQGTVSAIVSDYRRQNGIDPDFNQFDFSQWPFFVR